MKGSGDMDLNCEDGVDPMIRFRLHCVRVTFSKWLVSTVVPAMSSRDRHSGNKEILE